MHARGSKAWLEGLNACRCGCDCHLPVSRVQEAWLGSVHCVFELLWVCAAACACCFQATACDSGCELCSLRMIFSTLKTSR